MKPTREDARRALLALLNRQEGVFGCYTVDKGSIRCGFYPIMYTHGTLRWWPDVTIPSKLACDIIYDVLREAMGCDFAPVPVGRGASFNDVGLGPLGIAALRAHLSATNPIA